MKEKIELTQAGSTSSEKTSSDQTPSDQKKEENPPKEPVNRLPWEKQGEGYFVKQV